MRILYLANASQIGGGNRVLLELWSGLKERGITPLVVCPAEGPLVGECYRNGIPCHVIEYHQPSWRQPFRTWQTYRTWCRLLRDLRVDLIHANDIFPARSIGLAARRSKIPLLCHIHFPPTREMIGWCFRSLPKPDLFLFCSRALQDEVGPAVKRASPATGQVVIHNGVSLDVFQPAPGTANGRHRVGILANLIPVKGHLDFLDMARELTERRVEAEYWVIGDDVHRTGYREQLERRSHELGLQERVRFLGHCRNVPELVNQLDVVVCSSHVEPFGMCLIEAMACERSVVATHVGGIPEVVEDGQTGLLVPPRSPKQLAAGVERLLRDSDLRRTMGRAGRSRVKTHFSQAAYANKTLAVYQTFLR